MPLPVTIACAPCCRGVDDVASRIAIEPEHRLRNTWFGDVECVE